MKCKRSRSHNLYMEDSQTIKCKSGTPKRISASSWRNKILLFEYIASRSPQYSKAKSRQTGEREEENGKFLHQHHPGIIYCSMLCSLFFGERMLETVTRNKNFRKTCELIIHRRRNNFTDAPTTPFEKLQPP